MSKLEMPIEDFAIAVSKENARLNAEIERLRALLRVAMPYVWFAARHSKDHETAAEAKHDLAKIRKALEAKHE